MFDTNTGSEFAGKKGISAVCHNIFNDTFTVADTIIFTGSKFELVSN